MLILGAYNFPDNYIVIRMILNCDDFFSKGLTSY